MSRNSNSDESSLDLLLDTICNAFGGVLFISILVVVLISVTSSQRSLEPEDAEGQFASTHRKLSESQAALDDIKEQLRQQKIVENAIYDPGIADDLQNLRDSQIDMANLLIGKGERQGTLLSTIQKMGAMQDDMKEAKMALQVSQKRLEAIEILLKMEIENRSQSAKLPRAAGTSKTEHVLFLKAGKLCAYSNAHPNEFLVGNKTVEPNPSAGLSVTEENVTALNARLTNEYASNRDALTFFVWPDSFEAFQILKDRLVSMGFDYSLQPIPMDEKIKIGNTSEQRDFMGR